MNFTGKALTLLVIFLASSKGLEFNCHFHTNISWNIVGSVYTCTKTGITLSNNSTSLESVQGEHMTGNTNEDVRGLDVRNDVLMQRLPRNIEAFFPNLQVFRWLDGSLTSVRADDFPFPDLKVWVLDGNKIINLDGDLFKNTPHLASIWFFNNQLTNVGQDLLSDLNELTQVYFYNNPCINFGASTPDQIQELKQKLLTQCPPLLTTSTAATTTTTEETCDIRCSVNEEIDELMTQLLEQKETIEILHETNSELRQKISEQNEWITNNFAESDERFLELEKQIREILAVP